MTDPRISPITLRPAMPQDAVAIASLKVLCWQTAYQGLIPATTLDALDVSAEIPHWRAWLEDETSGLIAYLLQNGDELIGYGLAGPMRLGDRPDSEIDADAEIYALYIHPEFQRRGFGQRLFGALIEKLVAAQYRAVGLWMVGGNLKAEGFYEKLGGLEVGKRVDIRNGRIVYREKAWCWRDLKQLHARLTVHII